MTCVQVELRRNYKYLFIWLAFNTIYSSLFCTHIKRKMILVKGLFAVAFGQDGFLFIETSFLLVLLLLKGDFKRKLERAQLLRTR